MAKIPEPNIKYLLATPYVSMVGWLDGSMYTWDTIVAISPVNLIHGIFKYDRIKTIAGIQSWKNEWL